MTTPADDLHAAAALLRERAAAAQTDLETADYWTPYDTVTAWRDGHVNGFGGVSSEYVAMLPPSAGLALADWLDAYGLDWDRCPADHPGTALDEHALTVARQILRTETDTTEENAR